MSRAKAKRPAKKSATSTAPATKLQLSATTLDRLHKAHDDLNRGICIVDCVIGSLAGKEVYFAEQEALSTASKLIWPASEWISDVRVEHDTGGDDEREM